MSVAIDGSESRPKGSKWLNGPVLIVTLSRPRAHGLWDVWASTMTGGRVTPAGR